MYKLPQQGKGCRNCDILPMVCSEENYAQPLFKHVPKIDKYLRNTMNNISHVTQPYIIFTFLFYYIGAKYFYNEKVTLVCFNYINYIIIY